MTNTPVALVTGANKDIGLETDLAARPALFADRTALATDIARSVAIAIVTVARLLLLLPLSLPRAATSAAT
jgi:hypothetical protein